MLRIMSFVEPATSKELILPVTPARYFWRHPTKLETVSLDQLGEATLHGGYKMGDCTLEDVLLPAQQYPFIVPGGRVDPYGYLYDLEVWCDTGAQLQWIVSGTSVNASVVIEEITQGERDGTNDLYLTIVMKQWRRLETPVLFISGGGASTQRDSQTGASSTKTYTVQSGDCLWTIAEQLLPLDHCGAVLWSWDRIQKAGGRQSGDLQPEPDLPWPGADHPAVGQPAGGQ